MDLLNHNASTCFLLVTFFIIGISSDDIKTMVLQLAHLFNTKYVHIYDDYEDTNLIKYFSQYYIMTVYNSMSFLDDLDRRALFVFINVDEEVIKTTFSYIYTQIHDPCCHTWVQIDSFKAEFEPERVPYNCEFLLIQPNGSSDYTIIENYSFKKDVWITDFGYWNQETGLQVSSQNLYQRRRDLNQTVIIVNEVDCLEWRTCEEREIWDDLSKMTNFRYKVDLQYEGYETDCNAVGIPFPILFEYTYSRVWPLVNLELNVFIKTPVLKAENSTLFMPCSIEMWNATGIWLIAAGVLMGIMGLCSITKHRQILQMCFTPLDGFCNQDGSRENVTAVRRLATLTSRLLAVVFIPAYSGALTSYLTLRTPVLPFTTMGEMLARKNYKILDASSFNKFSVAIEFMGRLNYTLLDEVIEDDIERICDANFAVIGIDHTFYGDKPSCAIVPLPEPAFKVFTGFRLKTTELMEVLNRNAIMFHSTGVISRMYQVRQRGVAQFSDAVQYLPVEFSQIRLVVKFVAYCGLLAFLILIAEIFVYYLMHYFVKVRTKVKER